ncbi:MAG: glycoside hydrolase family 97 N-terminal domain-containing protein [Phycisphaerae bacterium]|jgi:alpha-glucosidase|nr:glycoside hydrolase family 97 N-terminal domain-containing protein [Phycisphaerae bacterium]
MNKSVLLNCLAMLFVCCGTTHLQAQTWSVTSPGGNIKTKVSLKNGAIRYAVTLGGKEILSDASMGLALEDADGRFITGLKATGQSDAKIDETYTMPVGKRSSCVNRANEKTLSFKNDKGRGMDLIVRVYDDGMAWRYRIKGQGAAKVRSEVSGFNVTAGLAGWLQNYVSAYEGEYHKISGGRPKKRYAFPAIFESKNGWVLLTEASVYDYAGSGLLGGSKSFNFTVAPMAGGADITCPWVSPWRVAIIGSLPSAIVESTLVQNLNPACEIKDKSWIQPGATTFPWLTERLGNKNPKRMKQFVDMAAEVGWKWLEFDIPLAAGNGHRITKFEQWSKVPWIPGLVKYASDKGLKCYGWDHWRNLDTPEKCEKILGWYVKHGIKGIKIDFLNSDSQDRFKFRTFVVRQCAKRKLMLSFHGATAPRGQQRRWPHIATIEGVMGEEWYTFGKLTPGPVHNVSLVFTRNVVGSMDYHGTTFSMKPRGAARKTTDAHEMALAVVFESGWQCISVSPEGMKGHPARGFLRNVPTAWDDIKVISGRPDEYAVLARRKGRKWYLAGINAGKARMVKIPMDFLSNGKYKATIYRDGKAGATPTETEVLVESIHVDKTTIHELQMQADGGFGIVLEATVARQGQKGSQ